MKGRKRATQYVECDTAHFVPEILGDKLFPSYFPFFHFPSYSQLDIAVPEA